MSRYGARRDLPVLPHPFPTLRSSDLEGSSSMPGSEAGQVVTPGSAMPIRAWALEPDRRELQVGQAVRLSFDALPGRRSEANTSELQSLMRSQYAVVCLKKKKQQEESTPNIHHSRHK